MTPSENPGGPRAAVCRLTLSCAQAAALARLLQSHLRAYDEAAGGLGVCAEEEGGRGGSPEPFTGADLDLLEPLLSALAKRAT